MRTVKFYTLGCKVNQYETQEIRERFASGGFKEVDDSRSEKADIYVINTCTVTQTADRKSRYFIHYAYRQNPKAKIVVTGCYAELDSDSAQIARIPGVSHIIKNEGKYRIIELLNGQKGHNGLNKQNDIGISGFLKHTRAFLKIQDGCDNFCSYCKVPLVRDALKSKGSSDIIQETERLTKNGFKEIVLCGICLGSYGRDLTPQVSLAQVVRRLENTPGLLRLRLSSIEPAYVSEELIDTIACAQKFCRHLHIPLQSGDDEILKKMNRGYSRLDYINLIRKVKSRIPEIAISTDVLVGFPGENENNFRNTLDLIKEILPLKVHIFPYSARMGTEAFNLKGNLSNAEIKIRVAKLKKVASACSLKYKSQFMNRNKDVLIEESLRENPDYWWGLTDNYIKVLVASKISLKNRIILAKLEKINKDFFLAKQVES